jgi:hypothetical protein
MLKDAPRKTQNTVLKNFFSPKCYVGESGTVIIAT